VPYHGSTPQRVLDAPTATEIVLHRTKGANRQQRRHYRPPSDSTELYKVVHFRPMTPNEGVNEPAKKIQHKDPRRNVDGSRKKR
jgi:hypothetical protein